MLKLKEGDFLSVTSKENLSIDMFNILASVPANIYDIGNYYSIKQVKLITVTEQKAT